MIINNKNYSHEELQKIANDCQDQTSFAMALGFKYLNGQVLKKIKEIILLSEISVIHFDAAAKNKARRKYPIVTKQCPVCSKDFQTQIGNGEERATCSHSCSNTHFAPIRHTEESKNKTAISMVKHFNSIGIFKSKVVLIKKEKVIKYVDKICPICKIFFCSKKTEQICCSSSCSAKLKWTDQNYRNNLISQANKRVENNTHKGWISRLNKEPSFPEKITMEILDEINIKLDREEKVGNWFIDFADIDKKIAIEIDGKQHELPERKAKDFIKDEYLKSQGWTVHRIKWQKLTKEFRQEVKDTLSKILIASQ